MFFGKGKKIAIPVIITSVSLKARLDIQLGRYDIDHAFLWLVPWFQLSCVYNFLSTDEQNLDIIIIMITNIPHNLAHVEGCIVLVQVSH